jgi:small-conductance mechanosensitive channel
VSNEYAMMPLKFFAPWHLWLYLPFFARFFWFVLSLVCVRTLYSASRILLRLHSVVKRNAGEESRSILRSLTALRSQALNLRQLHVFAFCLFGLCFLVQIPAAFVSFGDSSRSGLSNILENLAIYIAYSADVFFVLLFLHSVQWFVTARIDSGMLRYIASRADVQQQL